MKRTAAWTRYAQERTEEGMDTLDRWAEDIVSALLEEKHLELVSKSSRRMSWGASRMR